MNKDPLLKIEESLYLMDSEEVFQISNLLLSQRLDYLMMRLASDKQACMFELAKLLASLELS